MKDKERDFMKKVYGVVFVLVCVFLLSAFPAAAADKTGFVDVREVMISSAAGKKATEELKKTFEKSRETIQAREAELKKMKEDIEKQKPLLKADALKEKEKSYEKKFRDYQLLVKDSNEDLQSREQDVQKKILPEILKIIRTLAEKGKYTMIIDTSQIPLPYFSKESDVTKQVIEELDRTYKPKK